MHVIMIHAVSSDSSRPLFQSFVQTIFLQRKAVNSKAYRAVSSAQSKHYFARKKSWSSVNSSNSAFLPRKTPPVIRQAVSDKHLSEKKDSKA